MSEFQDALGARKELPLLGKKWIVEPLDFNDFADIETVTGTDVFSIRTYSVIHQRAFVWAAIRKADPALTPVDKANFNYRITIQDVGKMLNFKNPDFKTEELIAFVDEVMRMSGLLPEVSESDAPDDKAPAAEGEQPKNPRSRSRK